MSITLASLQPAALKPAISTVGVDQGHGVSVNASAPVADLQTASLQAAPTGQTFAPISSDPGTAITAQLFNPIRQP